MNYKGSLIFGSADICLLVPVDSVNKHILGICCVNILIKLVRHGSKHFAIHSGRL